MIINSFILLISHFKNKDLQFPKNRLKGFFTKAQEKTLMRHNTPVPPQSVTQDRRCCPGNKVLLFRLSVNNGPRSIINFVTREDQIHIQG